jgi:LysR family nitrogen assimilation transcriptional regulator
MTKAAMLLHVAQPALGLQIKQLEEELGAALLERHSRGVVVTPAGKVLYERALKILRLMEEARTEVMAFGKEKRETLTFGATPSIVRLLGSELLIAARRDIPDVLLSLVEEPSFVLAERLERGEVDIALTYEVKDNPRLEQQLVLVEELLLVLRPDLAPAAETVSFREAAALELVMMPERDIIRQMVEAEARRQGVTLSIPYEVQSLQATRQVVRDGLAATIVPYGTVVTELRSGELVARRIRDPKIKRQLYLVRSANHGPANEESVSRLIRSVTRQLSIDLGDLAEPVPA